MSDKEVPFNVDVIEMRAELMVSQHPALKNLVEFAYTIGAGYVSEEIVSGYHSALSEVERLMGVEQRIESEDT